MIFLVLLISNLLFPLAALAVLAKFALSARRRVLLELGSELAERLGRLSPEQAGKLSGRKVLWIHAASAGEVAAVSKLVERIKRRRPQPAIVLTASTSAGRGKAQSLPEVDLAVMAPLDFFPTVARFIRAARPSALIIVETELWPNMIALARRRGLPIAVVNGRLTDKSFGRYRRLSFLVRPFLERIAALAVQTESDARRFLELGARPEAVRVAGNMKYDSLAPAETAPAQGAITALGWSASLLFVAGSTHPGEEEAVMEAYLEARKGQPGLKLAIAPRHVERAAQTAGALRSRGISHVLWSARSGQGRSPKGPVLDALVLDVHGILGAFYAQARVSFVGGTLVAVGGHNLLEPAIAGSPVVFGPHTFHTRDTARLLESAGCGFCVEDGPALARILKDLLSDPERAKALGLQARNMARGLQGATERTLRHLAGVLGSSERPA